MTEMKLAVWRSTAMPEVNKVLWLTPAACAIASVVVAGYPCSANSCAAAATIWARVRAWGCAQVGGVGVLVSIVDQNPPRASGVVSVV
jgi:hypothetical protein